MAWMTDHFGALTANQHDLSSDTVTLRVCGFKPRLSDWRRVGEDGGIHQSTKYTTITCVLNRYYFQLLCVRIKHIISAL